MRDCGPLFCLRHSFVPQGAVRRLLPHKRELFGMLFVKPTTKTVILSGAPHRFIESLIRTILFSGFGGHSINLRGAPLRMTVFVVSWRCGELEMQKTNVFSDFYCLPNLAKIVDYQNPAIEIRRAFARSSSQGKRLREAFRA